MLLKVICYAFGTFLDYVSCIIDFYYLDDVPAWFSFTPIVILQDGLNNDNPIPSPTIGSKNWPINKVHISNLNEEKFSPINISTYFISIVVLCL